MRIGWIKRMLWGGGLFFLWRSVDRKVFKSNEISALNNRNAIKKPM